MYLILESYNIFSTFIKSLSYRDKKTRLNKRACFLVHNFNGFGLFNFR